MPGLAGVDARIGWGRGTGTYSGSGRNICRGTSRCSWKGGPAVLVQHSRGHKGYEYLLLRLEQGEVRASTVPLYGLMAA